VIVAAAIVVATAAAAQSCPSSSDCGDSDADQCVAINELVGCVNCALAYSLDRCGACDIDRDEMVEVNELVSAVSLSLGFIPPDLRLIEGTCDRPCPAGGCNPPTEDGLQPCGEGDVTVSPCTETQCRSARIVPLSAGRFCFAMCNFQAPWLQFRDEATALTTLNLPPVGVSVNGECLTAAQQSSRAAQRITGVAPISISPKSEAVVRLVKERGLEKFDAVGLSEVAGAVEEANRDTNFAGQDPSTAAALAEQTARDDERVQETLDRNVGIALRIGQAEGRAGDRVTITVALSTGATDVAGTQNDLHFPPQAPIAARANGQPDCTVDPNIDKPASTFGFLPDGCTPGRDCSAVRAVIVEFGPQTPIPNRSSLYSCRVAIAAGATGPLPFDCSGSFASPPQGGDIDAACTPGLVTVQP
jgi:hypothetical protein